MKSSILSLRELHSQGRVKKLLEAQAIEPDEVKRGCKYYGPATLEKLKAALSK